MNHSNSSKKKVTHRDTIKRVKMIVKLYNKKNNLDIGMKLRRRRRIN